MEKNKFQIKLPFNPAGDQPKAISALVNGLKKGMQKQTLLGVTGSGKTFTIANVIQQIQKPTLIIAHNKTLAAQLAQEYRTFFPENAVHYFVSYYDYYQPEAYMPTTDTYIEKDAQINKEIDRLRHATTQALLTRKDVIIVASVSCIYGLGSPEEYKEENLEIKLGEKISRTDLMSRLIAMHFERTNADLTPGTFRAVGQKIEIMPVSENFLYSLDLDSTVKGILKIDPVSSKILAEEKSIFIFPAKHFITNKTKLEQAIKNIKNELKEQLRKFDKEGKILEAERLKRRTNYDIAMLREVGYCSGIENYSRHLSMKKAGEAPETLLSYFPRKESQESTLRRSHSVLEGQDLSGRSEGFSKYFPDFLTIIDESHVTLPQIGGMYAGDASRKGTLVDHGFRLPSAKDNRPLKYAEFEERIGQVIYVSATPSIVERENSKQIVEQIIRPTGLTDPELEVRPVTANKKYPGQVQDFIKEAEKEIKNFIRRGGGGGRVIATTLTKKMAEDLSTYLKEKKIKSEYLHSDIKTIERIKILTEFRKGTFDILVGVNLLREGLDLPELSFIGILDADKEGFLRSEVSLIQTIGRAARNVEGRVILYADHITGSMERAISETNRRRVIQVAYNKKNKITPKTIIKKIHDITQEMDSVHDKAVRSELDLDTKLFAKNPSKLVKLKERQMSEAVKMLDFETAAILRDELKILKDKLVK
ncbi:excinuclease ABC subunit UvrB [Candidatus Nomurabacteria bacterium]|nr:excinuclease ABC subunit UvrB [Candidatus Nomurabacteria bacterium]